MGVRLAHSFQPAFTLFLIPFLGPLLTHTAQSLVRVAPLRLTTLLDRRSLLCSVNTLLYFNPPRLRQVFESAPGARSLALSKGGGFLLTNDPDTGAVASLRLDPQSGHIAGVASAVVGLIPNAAAILAWAPQRRSSQSRPRT